MHCLRLAVLFTTAALLPACSPPIACTEEYRPAVQITVVDTQGRRQPDARVTYVRGDEPERQAECVPLTTGTGCDQWWAGPDEPGSFVITARSADGTRTVKQSVSVEGDLCHADTELVRLTLPD
ncbi:hypothetical protein [Archangium sp.]|uniref:hypothetical protein n=1 Tax=Archangium sp. TaxID=1872627 RepID=UPI00286A15AA|nr:hypothetical protein [Archangium sp.]